MIPAAVSAPPLAALCDGLKSRRRAERAQIGAAARGRSAVQTEAAARARTCHPAERDELGGSALSQHFLLPVLKLCPESLLEDLKAISQHVCLIYLYLDK